MYQIWNQNVTQFLYCIRNQSIIILALSVVNHTTKYINEVWGQNVFVFIIKPIFLQIYKVLQTFHLKLQFMQQSTDKSHKTDQF